MEQGSMFFVSLYSWMFPNSFILVLLDFVWYCYHQLSSISFFLFCMLFWGGCFLLMLIEWSREIGVSVWNYYQLYFSLYCCLTVPFPFYTLFVYVWKLLCLTVCKTENHKTIKHVCLKSFLIVFINVWLIV